MLMLYEWKQNDPLANGPIKFRSLSSNIPVKLAGRSLKTQEN